MAESYRLEDEAFPSFLCKSLDSTTLGNVTQGSGPGLPVATSTAAKIRPHSDNRGDRVEASYLEERVLQQNISQSSQAQQRKFALSFKDDMDNADDFIAAHNLSDMLLKFHTDDTPSRNQGSLLHLLPTHMASIQGGHTELPTDLSAGLLTFAQFEHKHCTDTKAPSPPSAAEKENVESEATDRNHFSGSNSSFVANEQLMSVDSMNSDTTDDDIDLNNLPDDELELYFNKLMPAAMERGTVEGQELPAADATGPPQASHSRTIEQGQCKHQIRDDIDQDTLQMPDVRLAATGMDSCPASDEDTEDELESVRQTSSLRTKLLPSTSRQLVGESRQPCFRPGLEGGSSDDEPSSGLGGPCLSGIEHRRSAEGQVINPPVTEDGGGGDGSSGSEEGGNNGGVSSMPFPISTNDNAYDVLRGLGLVGSSAVGEDGDGARNSLTAPGRSNLSTRTEMGDRVGPVGTVEASSCKNSSRGSQTVSPVNWSMLMDRREEHQDESGATTEPSRSVDVKREAQLQVTQDNSQAQTLLQLRGGPCGNASEAVASDTTSEEDCDLSTSLDPKYFCQSFQEEEGESDDDWNNCPANLDLEFHQGASAPHSVVYQDEEGQWVTDLAYYTTFEKETTQHDGQLKNEDFVSSGDALEKIIKDQEEFEKEHRFMQEEQIVPASSNSTVLMDSSWKAASSRHILMRASQVSSDFNQGDQSYLRLSLGQFFQQRSEALGCLGSANDMDLVKRPSFGFIISSPEKREPFALIHPSDLSPGENSPHSDSMDVSEGDKTLKPDDLDKTFEVAAGERMSPKGNKDVNASNQEDAVLRCNEGPDSAANQSSMSPQNNLMLSISTIASAIADASISTNPSQLAAMILQLSKKCRQRHHPETPDVFATGKVTEEPCSNQHVHPDAEQLNSLLNTLQSSSNVGEQSAFDMEKYLKQTDTSFHIDASAAQTTFDLTGCLDNFRSSKKMQTEEEECSPHESESASAVHKDRKEPRFKPRSSNKKADAKRSCTSLTHFTGKKSQPAKIVMAAPLHHSSLEKHVGVFLQNTQPPLEHVFGPPPEPHVEEETQCNFRPSTAPLTHSSPSQSSPPEADSPPSPSHDKSSPQSTCSSPSLNRLTYVSMNDATLVPTPERHKNNCSMALSTTIIRISPTPPVEPDAPSNQDLPKQSQRLEELPAQHSLKTCGGNTLSCTHCQSECGCPSVQTLSHKNPLESNGRKLTKVDYCSHSHIPQTSTTAAAQTSEHWGAPSSVSSLYSDGFHALPNLKPVYPGLMDLMQQGDVQSLLAGPALINSQLAQQYLASDARLNPGVYNVGAARSGLYSVSSSGVSNSKPTARHVHPTAWPLGMAAAPGSHHLPRSMQNHQDMGVKLYSQYGAEPLLAGGLEELSVQVVVPEELHFPNACCVGIASQTSLSLFNPSERWQQVSIAVASLAIDGEKVGSVPYQWLVVKNKTIIAPKSTEEQKVLFIPPKAGVYHSVLRVCSWPASANTHVAARAALFAKGVLLVAIAENPSIEVEVDKSGCLNFGDLPEGSSKSIPLKLTNMTRATVPIRLVVSAKATSWCCFTLSKQPAPLASEAAQPAGPMTPLMSPSVVNHVMHASYGENPECFMVWVHFKAWGKYTASSGELGLANEYCACIDVEVDSPAAGHVIKSVPVRARSGTAIVHAPKDLQTMKTNSFKTVPLRAALGKCCQSTLPLRNAGNIDVQMKLKTNDECFSVTPDQLFLTVGEERQVVVSFQAWGAKKYRESLLTILVLPSGPQYEVTLKGDVVPEEAAAEVGPGLASELPPILSNKQFVAWGGVTLGQAVQQKLVLRNNSSNAIQHLRLIIRGQDQDCFQLQSLFSPEERLSRNGELSIRPREDVAIHLLFAPTRVACMLAKLEIKQSGVRSSQPGVKFTIPLSGYGGTSNVILEDQRKEVDGYVASVSDVAVNHVSKVCLCVRNTGSRAAFIKAVAFSDVPSRSLMDPTVISLAPSQFVLKERTQEVVTVLLKCSQREQTLCQSETPLLATVLLFCGDEVSRQQYRRLLESKPDVGQKVLAENSLQKNTKFDETFLGEEMIHEAVDLPPRPNEAYVFYGQMRKVAVSLLGSTNGRVCEESDSTELLLTSTRQDLVTESGLTNGNVSLDVLPVKGPQGPAMRVTASSLKTSEPSQKQPESWTLHPQQLVLAVPTMNAVASTSQVQIKNNTSRELSFDLSWPARYLTITPQHGVIEPHCHLQIFISPNPSVASMLPWSGQIYVQCDGQQKSIKIQIRQDLALDVSATPADATLSALSPQAATPVLATSKSALALTPQQLAPALVHISNNILFPNTPSGETSEAQLVVENRDVEVRWYLSSFAPPYVKGVDNSCDVYRVTYTAFRCSRLSGTLGAHEKMQVPITFLPRGRGDYAQFWVFECHPLSEPQQKCQIRLELHGTGVDCGGVVGPQKGDCSLVKTEATTKARKKAEVGAGKSSQDEPVWKGVNCPQELYTFPHTCVGQSSTLKVNIRNSSVNTYELRFVKPQEPFHIKHSKYSLRAQHFVKLPVEFRPSSAGKHAGLLLVQSGSSRSLLIQLAGEALSST
ncbi:centrosomal protein of 192 kDa isoform X2 [Dunckerocampus dactyliophorus]|uniref:centrosomal protein of 192 kDa isoform X2 n=1 Tax=Dunckerocampus dactyliophorus TaxID=161453 RepID=UPI002406A687|nr:centrosomal protein of 192 kDa isoform X2 [Dunckerocampus dactyliophorus]